MLSLQGESNTERGIFEYMFARATYLKQNIGLQRRSEKFCNKRYASFLVYSIVTGQLDYRTRNIHVVFFLCAIEILTRS